MTDIDAKLVEAFPLVERLATPELEAFVDLARRELACGDRNKAGAVLIAVLNNMIEKTDLMPGYLACAVLRLASCGETVP